MSVTCCPLCGGALGDNPLRVDLKTNYVTFRGECRKATRLIVAELISILIRRPGVVSHEELIAGLWGCDGPDNQAAALRVCASRARKLLAGWDVRIVSEYGLGYRLKF